MSPLSRQDLLRRNPSLLFWGKALLKLSFLNGVITLFYIHRGVGIDQIFYLSIVWSITSLALEVPTGYLADRFGRRQTIILGGVLMLLSSVLAFFGHGFWMFVLVFIFMSASFCCFSGTDEALLYDGLKELGEERGATKHSGYIESADNIFNMIIPVIGAWIAKDLQEMHFQVLIILDMLSTMLGIYFLSRLVEPDHAMSLLKKEAGIFKESRILMQQDPFLLRIAFNKTLIFIGAFIVWRIHQPFLREYGVSTVWIGILYGLLHASVFLLKRRVGTIEDRLGSVRVLRWSGFVMIASCVIAALFLPNAWVLAVGLLTIIAIENVRGPVITHIINRRVSSRARATTFSQLNMLKGILDIPILLFVGWAVTVNLEYVLLVTVGLCLLGLVFFSVRERDLILKAE